MNFLAILGASLLVIGFVLVFVILIRCIRRGGTNMFLYPVSKSSRGIPESNAKWRTPPGKR